MKQFLKFFKLSLLMTALTLLPSGVVSAKVISPDFVDLARKLKPAVVNVSTSKTITPQRNFQQPHSQFGQDPFETDVKTWPVHLTTRLEVPRPARTKP